MLGNFPLDKKVRKLRKAAKKLAPTSSFKTLSVSEQLARRRKWNLTEIQFRLLQLLQIIMWCGGTLFILNLYPQTRIIPFLLIAALRIPFRICLVALIVYFLIRLSYLLIAQVSAAAIESQSGRSKSQSKRQVAYQYYNQNYT